VLGSEQSANRQLIGHLPVMLQQWLGQITHTTCVVTPREMGWGGWREGEGMGEGGGKGEMSAAKDVNRSGYDRKGASPAQ
jgi:hypothetical protein